VSPPKVESASTALPPFPPFPPLPSSAFAPPSAEEPVRAAEPALLLPPSLFASVPLPARLVLPSAELPPPDVLDDVSEGSFQLPPLPSVVLLVSPEVLVGSDVEVAGPPVADVDEVPPVAVDVPVALDVPPFALDELLFEPAPPAPPVRLIVNSLIAPLIWPTSAVFVFVLLPEFVPEELFDCDVSPCVADGETVLVGSQVLLLLFVLVVVPLPPFELPLCPLSAAAMPARASVKAVIAMATRVLRLCKTPPCRSNVQLSEAVRSALEVSAGRHLLGSGVLNPAGTYAHACVDSAGFSGSGVETDDPVAATSPTTSPPRTRLRSVGVWAEVAAARGPAPSFGSSSPH